jgi:hypothetical protein
MKNSRLINPVFSTSKPLTVSKFLTLGTGEILAHKGSKSIEDSKSLLIAIDQIDLDQQLV